MLKSERIYCFLLLNLARLCSLPQTTLRQSGSLECLSISLYRISAARLHRNPLCYKCWLPLKRDYDFFFFFLNQTQGWGGRSWRKFNENVLLGLMSFLLPWKVAQCGEPLLMFAHLLWERWNQDKRRNSSKKKKLLELPQSTFVATQIPM